MIDYYNRRRSAELARHAQQAAAQMASHNTGSSGGAAQALGGVNYSGNAARQDMRQAANYQNYADDASSAAGLNENAAMYNRQMQLAEQEQRNRYQLGTTQANAGANEAAVKANALKGMMGGMGNLGSINVQAPSTNLYDNSGNRIGGSYFRSALLGLP